MSHQTLVSGVPARLTSERYFALVDEGVLAPDDRPDVTLAVDDLLPPTEESVG